MAVYLLDINVLIALSWPIHQHHHAALQWLDSVSLDQWATCPITQCGLVRISSNPRSMPAALSVQEAIILLEQLVIHPGHVFWEDQIMLAASTHFPRQTIQGHQQVTDGYLFALALSRGGRLATFDQGIPSLARSQNERDAIVLVPT